MNEIPTSNIFYYPLSKCLLISSIIIATIILCMLNFAQAHSIFGGVATDKSETNALSSVILLALLVNVGVVIFAMVLLCCVLKTNNKVVLLLMLVIFSVIAIACIGMAIGLSILEATYLSKPESQYFFHNTYIIILYTVLALVCTCIVLLLAKMYRNKTHQKLLALPLLALSVSAFVVQSGMALGPVASTVPLSPTVPSTSSASFTSTTVDESDPLLFFLIQIVYNYVASSQDPAL
ncbi:hypothetical protein WR25_25847 [Diploscapter pachys]|uniref:Uncharacterized protein n=1 Tax=Diploscapter pachys TaxID=2018661 RepID=A0A2A2JLV8_9BILA|nr:hypothetical protein WR25_25847 [Diploscapter pachys]